MENEARVGVVKTRVCIFTVQQSYYIGVTTAGCNHQSDSCAQSIIDLSLTKHVGKGRQENSLVLGTAL